MIALVLFGVTLLLIGGALAVPVSVHRSGRIADRDAPVLGAAVLTFGLGGMNLAFAFSFFLLDDVSGVVLLFAFAPIVAGWLGLRVVRGKLTGANRVLSLAGAALFTLAGIPGYFATLVAILASVITAGLFLGGLVDNPRRLWKTLDPRL